MTQPQPIPSPAGLGDTALAAALAGLPEWRERLGALHTAYALPSAASALGLVAEIGAAAEAANHHPDLDWRYDHVFVRTTTHSAGGVVTTKDVELATRISELAAGAGAVANPALNRTIEIAVDTTDPEPLRRTWEIALGYRTSPAGDLVDPWGRGPNIWFQQTETPATSRLHLDVHVATESHATLIDIIEAETSAEVDAGSAPSYWIITDVDGNRVCICPQPEPQQPG